MLASAGAALGLLGATLLIDALPTLLPLMVVPLNFEFSIGPRVWLYALLLLGASALGFGLENYDAIGKWRTLGETQQRPRRWVV